MKIQELQREMKGNQRKGSERPFGRAVLETKNLE